MKWMYLLPIGFFVSCAQLSEPVEDEIVKKPSHELAHEVKPMRYLFSNAKNNSLKISLWDQKAWLLDSRGRVLVSTDVSTGIDGRLTEAGEYKVLEKIRGKRSNLYGRYVDDKSGHVVIDKAWEHEGDPPEGTHYEGILMPYWMRLSWDGVGMHVGKFKKRIRSSFGCIRVNEKSQPYFYYKTVLGTSVEIVEESLVAEMQGR